MLGSAISPDLGWAAGRRTQRRVRADHSSSWVMQRSRATPSTTSGTIDAGGVVDRTPERALVERRIEDQKPAVITPHRRTGEIVDTALGRRHHIGRNADQRQPHPRRWRPPCRIRGRRLLAHPDGQQSTVRPKTKRTSPQRRQRRTTARSGPSGLPRGSDRVPVDAVASHRRGRRGLEARPTCACREKVVAVERVRSWRNKDVSRIHGCYALSPTT